jgi:hypothetical protein
MYMALHVADPEVSQLVTDLAKLEHTTKTEALRRVLREAIKAKQIAAKREGFRELATRIAAEAREENVAPVTKQEMDDLWGMDDLVGH